MEENNIEKDEKTINQKNEIVIIANDEKVNTDVKATDDKLDKETLKRLKEIDDIINEWKRPAETNILNLIKFKNKEEKVLFDRLPLSDYDKEQMIKEIYDV